MVLPYVYTADAMDTAVKGSSYDVSDRPMTKCRILGCLVTTRASANTRTGAVDCCAKDRRCKVRSRRLVG